MEIEVNRVSESTLEIKFSEIPSSPLALYWTDRPDTQVYPENFITDKLENTITVQDPLNAKQRIYILFYKMPTDVDYSLKEHCLLRIK